MPQHAPQAAKNRPASASHLGLRNTSVRAQLSSADRQITRTICGAKHSDELQTLLRFHGQTRHLRVKTTGRQSRGFTAWSVARAAIQFLVSKAVSSAR